MAIKWRCPGIFNADVSLVNDEIQQIGDCVRPKELVDFARENPDSELHKCFEWNDSVAAEKYREQQAGTILRMIVEEPDSKEKPFVREYALTRTDTKSGYVPTRTFLVNHDEYEGLLERALAELRAFENKYKTLNELSEVFKAIDEL